MGTKRKSRSGLWFPASSDARPGVLVSRRDVLRCGLAGATGALLGGRPTVAAPAAPPPAARPATAKAVIQIWMWGGPAHTDTFDPKPEAGYDYTGPLPGTLNTNVDGIRVGELIPELAQIADKYSIIRSMTHGQFGHETASYLTQTGRMPGRVVYPMVGAVVSLFKGYDAGYEGLIPPYIVITQPQGRFSEAGFLGVRYKPFATGGNPGAARFEVEGVIAPGISDEQQRSRRMLMQQLNTLNFAMEGNPQLQPSKTAEDAAYDLILGDAGKVFDLAEEPEELRTRYGRSTFGQACLCARRLVQRGVPYITINYGGWDTHKDHFPIMNRKLPEMDKGMSTLILDLEEQGLLDSTIVWWTGEFGRGPKVQWEPPWNGGRSHYGHVFSTVVAGGGFKPGQVVGASDAKGERVKDRPVYPCDLIGSIYELLGIDPNAKLPHPSGLAFHATPTPEEKVPSAGRLKEIM